MNVPHVSVASLVLGALVASSVPLATSAASAAAAPSVAPPAAAGLAAGREVKVDFEYVDEPLDDGDTVVTGGNAGVDAVVRTHGDATADPTRGRTGGTALRLPALDPGATADSTPLAVVNVTAGSSLDAGWSPFAFGVAFNLDDVSDGNGIDDGNNLLQRGTYNADAQLKLQVDGRRPSCRVKGSAGSVMVRADRKVRTGRWFELKCRRTSPGVKMTLTRWKSDGSTIRETWWKSGQTGSMSGLSSDVPLSIGSKTQGSGTLVPTSSDQFNGMVDDVFFDIQS